jgi:hypothetical protein
MPFFKSIEVYNIGDWVAVAPSMKPVGSSWFIGEPTAVRADDTVTLSSEIVRALDASREIDGEPYDSLVGTARLLSLAKVRSLGALWKRCAFAYLTNKSGDLVTISPMIKHGSGYISDDLKAITLPMSEPLEIAQATRLLIGL